MGIKYIFYSLLVLFSFSIASTMIAGCAQIGMPTGGDKDSIPPVLLKAEPAERTTNFRGNKITLTFDEYVDVQDAQNNVLVSPYPKYTPAVSFKLKTITVKIKDSLLPNTTYSINFGNAIKDNNEGNPFRNYTYVFSTGPTIDSLQLSGKILMAESGKADSTITALLYRNVPDSAVQKRKPDYIAKLNSEGSFTFVNLSAGRYSVYGLKENDGSKTYNSPTEIFAFSSDEVVIGDSVKPVTLYAYAEEKEQPKSAASTGAKTPDKKFRYTMGISPGIPQDLLKPLEITFSKPAKITDEKKIQLTDSLFNKINGVSFSLDSTKKVLTINTKWAEGFDYNLIIGKDAVTDTAGTQLFKTDTIRFKSKAMADYGALTVRFKNYDTSKHLVLQFFKGEELYKSVPLTASTWSNKMIEPGEYELRVLYDENSNGKWDPGSYLEKRQPEKAITLGRKLSIRANWDNETDVEL